MSAAEIQSLVLNWGASCGFGLEAVLKRELEALGYAAQVVSPGHLSFQGDWFAVCQTNLWLRTADRVFADLGRFSADDFDTLFEATKQCPWELWIGPEDAFPVTAHSVRSKLTSLPACQRAVKKAIVQRLSEMHGVTELPETGTAYKVHVGIVQDSVSLTIDTTGPSLHRRGYRQRYRRDSMKETLAAAMVLLSYWEAERPLIDPFCGSGTIPIEAALIGCRIAPGRNRQFAAEAWRQIPTEFWDRAKRLADEQQRTDLQERIVGIDADPSVLREARFEAERAGVEESIHFQPAPFSRLSSKRRSGCIITNPPWFASQTNAKEIFALYRSMPDVFRKLPTWSFFILTDCENFEELLGRKADRRRKLYNDRIQCNLFQFAGPKPGAVLGRIETATPSDIETNDATLDLPSLADESGDSGELGGLGEVLETTDEAEVAVPEEPEEPPRVQRPRQVMPAAFGQLTAKAHEQAELFHRRLVKRAKHLRRWPTRQGITCFRLYERDIPEIPLVVDQYADHLHMTEYERPHDRDPALHANWLDLMAQTAAKALEIPIKQVFFKRRSRQKGDTQHQRMAEENYEICVTEGGLKFWVNLSDYVDTGLFLDHRVTRSMFRSDAAGKRILNLFAYTGAFSVYGAAGGAAETTTVDWSNSYLQWARRNMETNGFNGATHQFVRSDSLSFLQSLEEKPLFDLAIVDPPTFSNSKRTERDWEVQSGYVELLNAVLRRMPTGGIVYFSNNFRQFKFDATLIPAAMIHEISNQTVPADFRNRRIHRCWRMVK